MTPEQKSDLMRLAAQPIRIYSPSQRSIDRYGSLAKDGLLTITDVGSDTAQETILKVEITKAGRAALANT